MTPQIAKDDGFGLLPTGPESAVRVQIKAGDPVPPGVQTDVATEDKDPTPYRRVDEGHKAVDTTIGQSPQDAEAQAKRAAGEDVDASKLARPDAAASETDSKGQKSGSSKSGGSK